MRGRLTAVMIAVIAALAAAAASAEPLGFSRALELAVQNNLSVKLAKADSEAARGEALRAGARLLPALLGTASQSRVFKENLAAQGFASNGPFSPLLGPFDSFDARLNLTLKLLDVSAIRRYQSSSRQAGLAELEEKLAREQVEAAAGLAYVESLRAEKATQAAQADLDLASALERLAKDRHQAGVATGIDVARAQTHAAQARLKVVHARVERRQAQLRLDRIIGAPLASVFDLRDALSSGAVSGPEVGEAVQTALQDRLELRIAEERVEADRRALAAARAESLPSLTATGNYGLSGNLPDGGARATGAAGLGLALPLFSGGAIRGETKEARAALERSESARQDVAAQVEEDARLSLESLASSEEEVATADQAVALATRELKLAQDRFSAGAGDNIELVDAQDALASALDAEVAALARFHVARINLALALGRMGDFRL